MPPTQALETARARLAAEASLTLGAWDGERLVGTVTCVRETGRKNRHKATIVSMYVAREASGQGIGRALMTEIIAGPRRWPGLELLQLTVVTENDRARRLYHALGFRAVRHRAPRSQARRALLRRSTAQPGPGPRATLTNFREADILGTVINRRPPRRVRLGVIVLFIAREAIGLADRHRQEYSRLARPGRGKAAE